jgi:ribonucleoside-diphosphate reductase alpha chain
MIKPNFEFSPNGLKINKIFTKNVDDPFSLFNFEIRTSAIKNTDGSSVFKNEQVEVPDFWSQVATDILAQKYFRKKGISITNPDGTITDGENSIKQVAHRMALCWKNWGKRYKYFASEEDAQNFYDELIFMITNQMVAPNSPQWFNTGLYEVYKISGRPQGHYYADPVTGEAKLSEDAYSHCQPHACFIQSIRDDLVNEGGIFDVLTKEARLFKYGSGTGTNFSTLRANGEGLSGGGNSSGLMSFLSVFDRGAGSVKSGGTTRRAAKMVCLDLDHPDIETFIDWKMREEQKVAALVAGSKTCDTELKNIMQIINETASTNVQENFKLKNAIKQALNKNVPINYINRVLQLAKQGVKEIPFVTMDVDFESEAYQTVAGQNSNNSIRISNKFFNSLFNNGPWDLINRTDKKIFKTIQAKDLWDKVNYAAWMCADPGVQYDTTINEWHTCPKDGRINASNPCSEYMFLDDTACNLASINLIKFYDESERKFKVEEFKHAIRLWTIVLEISIVMAQFPAKQIAINSFLYRSLGLGFANIGSLIMQMGFAYDSEYGRAFAGGIAAIMGGKAYETSAELASVVGPFAKYESNKEDMLKVIRNHKRAVYAQKDYEDLTIKPIPLNQEICPKYILEEAHNAWDSALLMGEKYGYRNAQVTVLAPTGTIGLVMDCDTTGIEPDFALVKFKKLVGGGYLKS